MRAHQFVVEDNIHKENIIKIFRDFLPLVMEVLGIGRLPKMVFEPEINTGQQPSFGMYVNSARTLYVALNNRHPNDILRTIAHELVHYKQDIEHRLNDMSGTTGSREENEANAIAGIVMRRFNKQFPQYLKSKPIVSESKKKIVELNVVQTLKFIKQAHGNQLYGPLPYWTHPRSVALTGRKVFGPAFNSDAVKVAFLHDVVEDTNIGLDELSKLDFAPIVIQAVELLTKNKALSYAQNIQNIINSGNKLAMMVKYADNYENYTGDKSDWDPARAERSQSKYLKSLNALGAKLGVAHHT